MDRIDGANWVDIGGGKRGFRKRNAAAGVAGTELTPEWLTDVQEELLTLLSAASINPVKGNRTQVYQAILWLIANHSVGGGGGGGLTAEQIRDLVADLITGSELVSVAYDDPGDSLTIGVTRESIRDLVAGFIQVSGLISKVHDDPGDKLTLTVAADLLEPYAQRGTLCGLRSFSASKAWVPTAAAKSALCILTGGGGAGGGVPAASNNIASCGGGASEVKLLFIPDLAASYQVIIGAGGIGATNAKGGDGGTSYLKLGAATLLSAVGGKGGATWKINTAGAPGAGGTGGVTLPAIAGERVYGGDIVGGAGGGNWFGPGGPSTPILSNGIDATAWGTGGSGANGNNNANKISGRGGHGKGGFCLALEFR